MTFTMGLMSNHTTKMKSMVISIFLKFCMVKLFKILHDVIDVKNLLPQIKIFE